MTTSASNFSHFFTVACFEQEKAARKILPTYVIFTLQQKRCISEQDVVSINKPSLSNIARIFSPHRDFRLHSKFTSNYLPQFL